MPDKDFGNTRWENRETGWDIGYPSPGITAFIDEYHDKEAAILIPGCGNAYEAEYLVKKGFQNITLIDIAPKAVEQISERFSGMAQVKIICGDFFEHKGLYDLMIEQTFFCAISPNMRQQYAQKSASLLRPGGTLAGLLFNTVFEKEGPPFGGGIKEYLDLFSPYFEIKMMDECCNSIPPRAGNELIIELLKK